MGQEPLLVAASTMPGPQSLAASATHVALHVATNGPESADSGSLVQRLRRVLPGRQVYLNFVDLVTNEQPGVTYNVYLDLPAGHEPSGANDPHYVGSLNLFGAGPNRGRGVSLNVTDNLKDRLAQGDRFDELRVTIVPGGSPARDASPRIGKVTLTAR